MRVATVRHGDISLVADLLGPEHGPTLLLLHAGGERRSVFAPIAPVLVDAGWRTIALDLRGHGESARASEYRLDDFIGDVLASIDTLADAPLIIAGGSIGGALGMLVAGEARVPVDGLVLLDVPSRLRGDAALGERDKIHRGHARGAPALAHLDPVFLSSNFVPGVLAQADRWQAAARALRMPVLLIHGKRSPVFDDAALAATRADIAQLEVASVPGGHLVARDCPAQVAAHLARFAARIAGSAL